MQYILPLALETMPIKQLQNSQYFKMKRTTSFLAPAHARCSEAKTISKIL